MNANLTILANYQVASPCDASWEEMAGDEQKRFCGKCEKHVYNLPMLSPEELVDLIETTEGKFCGRLFARNDGTVLTNDCPIGLKKLGRARTNRQVGVSAVIAALCVAGVAASMFAAAWGGCGIDSPRMVAGEMMPIEQPVQPVEPTIEPTIEPTVEPPPVEVPEEEPQIILGKMAPRPKAE